MKQFNFKASEFCTSVGQNHKGHFRCESFNVIMCVCEGWGILNQEFYREVCTHTINEPKSNPFSKLILQYGNSEHSHDDPPQLISCISKLKSTHCTIAFSFFFFVFWGCVCICFGGWGDGLGLLFCGRGSHCLSGRGARHKGHGMVVSDDFFGI